MTDEEMAEEYFDNECLHSYADNSEQLKEDVVPAFLAGLKARLQWHDLRKDPNDLPPKIVSNHNFSIEVLSDRGEIVCYNFHYCEWFYWRRGKPIAWCEIPTFDKE